MNTIYVSIRDFLSKIELTGESSTGRSVPVSVLQTHSDFPNADPRILQDVQRALKLKARREARAQATTSTARSELTNTDLSSINSPLSQAIFPMISASTSPRKASISSDVDFSPLTGVTSVHPVPASLDNGITLDWSGLASNERSERRWKLSTTKRREKEQLPHLNLVMDQLEKTHSGKAYDHSFVGP
jgi:hypothetical protein